MSSTSYTSSLPGSLSVYAPSPSPSLYATASVASGSGSPYSPSPSPQIQGDVLSQVRIRSGSPQVRSFIYLHY